MDAHLPTVYFNQRLTPKSCDIKWTHICLMFNQCSTPKTREKMDAHLPNVYYNQRFTPKTRDIKWTPICLMSTLINALPRILVILNGRTFPSCLA